MFLLLVEGAARSHRAMLDLPSSPACPGRRNHVFGMPQVLCQLRHHHWPEVSKARRLRWELWERRLGSEGGCREMISQSFCDVIYLLQIKKMNSVVRYRVLKL